MFRNRHCSIKLELTSEEQDPYLELASSSSSSSSTVVVVNLTILELHGPYHFEPHVRDNSCMHIGSA